MMLAVVLWSISDFPAYADMSSCSTKGYFSCPFHKETRHASLKNKGASLSHPQWLPLNHKWRKDANSFDNTKERGTIPVPLAGDDVLVHCRKFKQVKFGKIAGSKRK